MDQASSLGSRIRGSASALMTDCLSKVSPLAATSTLASATGTDGKLHSASTIGDISSSVSSSRIYSPRGLEDTNVGGRSGEQGFRTRSSRLGCDTWDEEWAFEMFPLERRMSYPDHASDSSRLLEESSLSAQGDSQDLDSNRAYQSSRFIDGGINSPHEQSDGAAVVALLSSPNFAIQSLEDGELDSELENDQNRNKTTQLKPELDTELRNLASVNPLYLLPKFSREASDVPERHTGYLFTANISSTRTFSDPPSTSDIMQPWIRMNNNYLVDVWDVLGLAEEKVYSEAVVPQDDAEVFGRECSATSRLAMIKKHIHYLDQW